MPKSSIEQPAQDSSAQADADAQKDDAPKRLVQTCLSSFDNSKGLGLPMIREAKRRCLDQVAHKAFIGDGLPANWAIWKNNFRDIVPILDFMLALEYHCTAAKPTNS
ncbi:MAG: hypothetical protein KDA80_06965 [Planctomycetaceae bacterium]|nr:hypothetical protein [Planctomycetaceae bacterium]